MHTGRLEAFSDGVIAIIITIMVLELRMPETANFSSLLPLYPKFLSYILSFIYVGIYWNNHHHLFQTIEKVNGKILWANLGLLFCLSLIPLTTAWMGENHFAGNPAALYGFSLMFCATAWTVLVQVAIKHEGENSKIGQALRNKTKEYISIAIYLMGIIVSFYLPIISIIGYTVVALIWLVPDKRMEKMVLGKK